MTEEASQQGEPWHLDKRVPVALILAIGLQTSAGIWWAATQTARVDEIARLQVIQDRRIDAVERSSNLAAVSSGRTEQEILGLRESMTRIERTQEQTNALLRRYLEGRRP